jgi:hypothetical protein
LESYLLFSSCSSEANSLVASIAVSAEGQAAAPSGSFPATPATAGLFGNLLSEQMSSPAARAFHPGTAQAFSADHPMASEALPAADARDKSSASAGEIAGDSPSGKRGGKSSLPANSANNPANKAASKSASITYTVISPMGEQAVPVPPQPVGDLSQIADAATGTSVDETASAVAEPAAYPTESQLSSFLSASDQGSPAASAPERNELNHSQLKQLAGPGAEAPSSYAWRAEVTPPTATAKAAGPAFLSSPVQQATQATPERNTDSLPRAEPAEEAKDGDARDNDNNRDAKRTEMPTTAAAKLGVSNSFGARTASPALFASSGGATQQANSPTMADAALSSGQHVLSTSAKTAADVSGAPLLSALSTPSDRRNAEALSYASTSPTLPGTGELARFSTTVEGAALATLNRSLNAGEQPEASAAKSGTSATVSFSIAADQAQGQEKAATATLPGQNASSAPGLRGPASPPEITDSAAALDQIVAALADIAKTEPSAGQAKSNGSASSASNGGNIAPAGVTSSSPTSASNPAPQPIPAAAPGPTSDAAESWSAPVAPIDSAAADGRAIAELQWEGVQARANWTSDPVTFNAATDSPATAAVHGGKKTSTAQTKAAPDGPEESQRSSPLMPDSAPPPQAQAPLAATASAHANPPTAPAATATATATATPSSTAVAATRQPASPGDASGGDNPAAPASGSRDSATPAPVVVQSARVLERMGQTEMRVGVNTADFGNVELRASVCQDRVGASINATHIDLRTAMMAEMPSLERAMQQQHLRLDQLDFGAQTGSQDRGASAQQQPRSSYGAQAASRASPADDTAPAQETAAPSAWVAPQSSGLNVHA